MNKAKRERIGAKIFITIVLAWLDEAVLHIWCGPVQEPLIKFRCKEIFGFSLTSGIDVSAQVTGDPLFESIQLGLIFLVVSLVFWIVDLARKNTKPVDVEPGPRISAGPKT